MGPFIIRLGTFKPILAASSGFEWRLSDCSGRIVAIPGASTWFLNNSPLSSIGLLFLKSSYIQCVGLEQTCFCWPVTDQLKQPRSDQRLHLPPKLTSVHNHTKGQNYHSINLDRILQRTYKYPSKIISLTLFKAWHILSLNESPADSWLEYLIQHATCCSMSYSCSELFYGPVLC